MIWVVNRWGKKPKYFSITYFNDSVDKSILDAEGNSYVIIAIPIIECTFDNDHIHVLHYIPK